MKLGPNLFVYVCFTCLVLLIGIVSAAFPTITSITPGTGVNTNTISITNLAGTNFEPGATVILTPVNDNPVHESSIIYGPWPTGPFMANPLSVYVSGNYAYVESIASNSLDILDVSNPSHPAQKGSILGLGGQSVYVSGNYAYVAGGNALEIVDVSNPSHPVNIGGIADGTGGAMLNEPFSVYVSGNYAYVASYGSNALEIVDVSNPATPVHKGSITDGTGGAELNRPYSVYVSGNYAYVASWGSDALEIVDVSNPAAPVHKGSIVNGGSTLLHNPQSVYVSGNYAYVASTDSNALEIVDVTDPANPVHKGSLVHGAGGANLYEPYSVYVSGNYAYVASFGGNALEIVDVTNPAAPVHKGSITDGTGGAMLYGPDSVYVSGDYAYLSVYYNNGVEIVNIGQVPATGVTVSPTQITCSFDLTNYIAGLYNVVVTNPDGNFGVLGSGFTVVAPPTVTSLTPTTGGTAGNTIVTVTGSGFTGASAVIFGTTAATSFTVNSDTQIIATTPAGSAGTVDVTVTNPYGTSTTSSADTFTYESPPTVTGITPATGSSAGGTSVTITGSGFTGATAVNFGSVAATSFTVNSDTSIIAVSPLETAGTIDVTVTTSGGTSALNPPADQFTYSAPPAFPIGKFTVSPTTGNAPLTVTFTDQSLNNPTGWAWFFGDEKYTAPWTQQTASAGWSTRWGPTGVAIPDGSIVLMGGSTGPNGGSLNDVWRSTDDGVTWTEVTANAGWTPRELSHSVVMPDGSIVLMGGYNFGSGNLNDVWRSTDEGATWTQMTASAGWTGRSSFSSVAMPDGSIVLMGGWGSSDVNDVWRSTDNGATWTEMTTNAGWTPRQGLTSVAMPDGSIVLMGGEDSVGNFDNDVWRSTDNGATWIEVNASAGWMGRYGQSSVAMPDGSIVLMGGTISPALANGNAPYVNDVWRSTDDGATWTEVNAIAGWTGRYQQSSVAMPDGSIVLMGGVNSWSPGPMNDVWRLMPAGSSAQNPSHIYTTPGSYQVSLQVYNSNGYNSTRIPEYISVTGLPPIATPTTVVSSSENPSTLGDTVTFTATVSPSTATGNVQFVIDGMDAGSPVTISGGTATYATSGLAVGAHTVEADSLGDANDLPSSGVLSPVQTVNQIQSSISVVSSENPSTLGDTVTFTATVTPSTATGSVQFLIDGSPFGTPVTISGGTATSGSISTLAVGTHTVGADYSGDTNDAASIGTLSPVQTVNPLTTSIIVSSSLNPSTYGQTVAFAATVSPSSATGTVQFIIDGTPFGAPVTLSSGTATSGSISTLIGGTHTIEVDYSGDTNDAASSGTTIQTVNPVSTSTGLSSSKNPSTYGDTITFTAKVKPTTATGTVQFKIDGSLFGSPVTLSGGIATSGGISTLTGGTHTIEADYSGDTNDAASSWTMSQTVKKASSAIIVSSSPNPSVYGQPVTLTATVTPSSATGTVTFKDGKATLGTGTITGGTATFTTSTPLKVGSQSLTAVYGGDTNYAKSTSSAITQAVNQASTTTSVTSSLNPAAYGQPVILTATVSVTAPGGGTPTGTVTFFDGTTSLGTAPVSKPKITVKTLAVGSHSITAVYNGNANFVASTSSVLTETVNLAPTTVTLKSSLNPSASGKLVTFTATVRPKSATGTVTFMDGSTQLGTVNLASGAAKYTTSSLSVGSHAITAMYSGNTNYGTSTSIVLTQTITA